jgi:N-acetylmuramoyl-L-alanine amidase
MEIRNHLLFLDPLRQAHFSSTKNFGKVIKPLYLVVHYTAATTASGAIEWFKNPESNASAHLVIDRDGTITQMVPFNRRAWHAGESKWGELSDVNSYSIGIEIVNAGKLRKRTDGTWLTWSKHSVPDDEVTLATHKNEQQETGWHEYTERQIQVTLEVGKLLASKYELVDVLGHDDVAPTRKVDPGPLFPMSSARSRILGREA